MNYLAAQQADTGNGKEDWATLMGHLMMAQRADPDTMLGFGLGQLLRDAYMNWHSNYVDRGRAKDRARAGQSQAGISDGASVGVSNGVQNAYNAQMLTDAINSGATNGALRQGLLGSMGQAGASYGADAYKQGMMQGALQSITNPELRKGMGVSYDYSNFNKSYWPIGG